MVFLIFNFTITFYQSTLLLRMHLNANLKPIDISLTYIMLQSIPTFDQPVDVVTLRLAKVYLIPQSHGAP